MGRVVWSNKMKLRNLFKRKKEQKEDISIHEGRGGYYHIAINDIPLCGDKNTMRRGLPLASWGIKSHIGETYCKECEELWMKKRK